jgi:Protein of unknown function (DUF3037)
MAKYQYSVVRCVPEPSTGEFINIGAIAGSWEEGDWAARQIGNWQRALRLCSSAQLGVVSKFIADATDQIEAAEAFLYPLDQHWLESLRVGRRNIIQLSEPQLAFGDSADQVLDYVFSNQLIEPAKTTRKFIDKNRLLTRIKNQVRQAIPNEKVAERPFLTVGGHITTQLDIAFGADRAVQLTQAFSFQKGTVDEVATDVKAWGYVLEKVRNGAPSRLMSRSGLLSLGVDVDLGVVIAEPTTPQQTEIFEEASEVFKLLEAHVYTQDEAEGLVADVAELLSAA